MNTIEARHESSATDAQVSKLLGVPFHHWGHDDARCFTDIFAQHLSHWELRWEEDSPRWERDGKTYGPWTMWFDGAAPHKDWLVHGDTAAEVICEAFLLQASWGWKPSDVAVTP